MTIAEAIRAEVRRRGWSMRETSIRSGVAYSGVHGFLTGERDIKLSVVQRLTDALELELRPKRRKGR